MLLNEKIIKKKIQIEEMKNINFLLNPMSEEEERQFLGENGEEDKEESNIIQKNDKELVSFQNIFLQTQREKRNINYENEQFGNTKQFLHNKNI